MRLRATSLLIAAGLMLVGCVRQSPPSTPRVPLAAGYLGSTDEAPAELPMPPLPRRLEPARAGIGDLEALSAAIGERRAVRLDADRHAQGASLDGALSDWLVARGVTVASGPRVLLQEVVTTPLPARLAEDGERRRFDASSIQVLTPEGGVRLVLGRAAAPPDGWGSLPVRVQGGCESTLAALGRGQESTLALLEPFLDEVELGLAQRWGELAPARLTAAIERLPDPPDACAVAGRAYLEAVAACARSEQRCPLRPRVYLQGGLSIGIAEPPVAWTEACSGSCDVNPRAVVRELAVEVVGAELGDLDVQWSERAERLAALGELQDAIEDVCAPRRWWIPAPTQERAGAEVMRAAAAFRGPPTGDTGAWRLGGEPVHVSGLGPVLPLATFESGPGSAPAKIEQVASGLRPLVLDGASCQGRPGEPPWAVLLLEGARIVYYGLYHGEELACPASHDNAGPTREG